MYVAGHVADPKAGRKKGSVRSVKGMLSRFVLRELSPQKLKTLFSKLTERDRAYFLIQALPYVCPRESADGLSQEEVDKLYDKLNDVLTQKQSNGKAAI